MLDFATVGGDQFFFMISHVSGGDERRVRRSVPERAAQLDGQRRGHEVPERAETSHQKDDPGANERISQPGRRQPDGSASTLRCQKIRQIFLINLNRSTGQTCRLLDIQEPSSKGRI